MCLVVLWKLFGGICPCMPTRDSLKVGESHHDHRDVVQRLPHEAIL